jgi:ATP synthase subunit 6
LILNFFEQFDLVAFFTLPLVGITISKLSIYLLFAIAIFLFLFGATRIQWTIFPSNWQSIMELTYEFLYSLIKSQIGKAGLVYLVLIADLFLWIACLNMLGMFPFGFTVTSHIATTGGLALAIFIGIQLIGIVIHRLKFLQLFLPNGAPTWLIPIIPVIEFMSYSFRVLSLAVRLIANMTSGHLLIHIFAGFCWKILTYGGFIILLFPVAFIIVFFLTGMEIGISLLQAYVFTILVCIYLVDVIYSHHE